MSETRADMSPAVTAEAPENEALTETERDYKHAPLIPHGRASGGPLFIVVAVMSFLASLALGLTLTLNRVVDGWSTGLTEAVTVQLRRSEEMNAGEQLERTLVILRETAGVREVRPLPRAESQALLEPWLGRGNLPSDLDLPQLVDVRISVADPPDMVALTEELREAVPGAVIDDHSRWKARLDALSGSVRGIALATLSLILLATVAIIVFATRAVLAANRDIVEILHQMGARDSFIAGEFQRHFLIVAGLAGAIGALAALAALFALGSLTRDDAYFSPAIVSGLSVLPALVLIPLFGSLVSMLTARLTALAILGRSL